MQNSSEYEVKSQFCQRYGLTGLDICSWKTTTTPAVTSLISFSCCILVHLPRAGASATQTVPFSGNNDG